MATGKLILVPTPIGNLKDLTFRSLEVLKGADLILAEDTRTSGKLLKHYNIEVPTRSYHKYNEHRTLQTWLDQIRAGRQIALISDAGTPGISDPGFLICRACIDAGLQVECLPGPTAFIPALICSGLPCDRFVFEGFLPLKKGRKTRLEALHAEQRTMVFYESPHKLLRTLNDFKVHFGADRRISISREISKIYEETVRGSVKELIDHFEAHAPRGEFVLVLAGKEN